MQFEEQNATEELDVLTGETTEIAVAEFDGDDEASEETSEEEAEEGEDEMEEVMDEETEEAGEEADASNEG